MRKMKDSGVEWIGEIPEDWIITKYKYFSKNGMGLTILKTEVSSNGVPIYSATQSNEIFGYISNPGLLLKYGDLVIPARGNSIGFVTFVVDEEATCTQTTIYSMLHDICKKYAYYCCYGLQKYWFNYDDTAIPQITVGQIENNILPFPPIDIQHLIADYLDDKCGKIDRYIEKQQKIIDKLKEYKQAVITEAVRCREGWTSCHLGYLAQFKNGLNYSGLSTDVEISFLGVGDFQNNFILDSKEMFSRLKYDGNMPEDLLLSSGDIVFVRSNGSKELVGRSVLIENVDYPLTYSGFCIRMRNYRQDVVLNKFLLYRFWSNEFRQNLNRDSRGSNINNLNQELLSKLTVSFPDIEKQHEIIGFLGKKCAEIDRAIDKKQSLIEKLTEYKESLIYEAVTGKLEV